MPNQIPGSVESEELAGLARGVERATGSECGGGYDGTEWQRRLPEQLTFRRKRVNAIKGGEMNGAIG